MVRRVIYFTRVAISNMAHNLFTNLVAVITLGLSLLILSSFFLLYTNLASAVRLAGSSVGLTVYVSPGASSRVLGELKAALGSLEGVRALAYTSKEQALAELKKRLGDKASLLDGLDENPLPASFELTLAERISADQGTVAGLIARIRELPGVAEVDYGWEWAEKLAGLINFIKLIGLLIGGLLFLATVFIVSNTIKLTVYSRKEEIGIVKLMGATQAFIKAPFYIEGFLQGLCGSLLSLGGLWVLFKLVISQVRFPFGLSLNAPAFLSANAAWGLLGLGVALGLMGSFVSLGRFMRL